MTAPLIGCLFVSTMLGLLAYRFCIAWYLLGNTAEKDRAAQAIALTAAIVIDMISKGVLIWAIR